MKKIEIIPAILPRDFAELEDKISYIKGSVKTVQVDICDGQFTPNPTWPYRKKDETFERILKEEDGLPGWEDINYEMDLMVNRPEEVVGDWLSAGAERIIIHAEAKGDLVKAIEIMKDKVEIGLALNIETSLGVIEPYMNDIQFVQCMGIGRIGFQGQSFDNKVIDKIKEIKAKYPKMIVSVDGGVSLENANSLIEAGADRLVVGSAIFGSDNVFEAISKFNHL